jgi:tryptophan halogenase
MRCLRAAHFLFLDFKMSNLIKIVIVGGGTAGWMMAAALATHASKVCEVVLIESDEIGSVGVGEATLPQMKNFNDYIGINEVDMMQKTNASFKVGIEFVNWGWIGNSYIHPFGKFGGTSTGIDFHQMWSRVKDKPTVQPLESYSFAIQACRQQRFSFPVDDSTEINSTFSYAYHFDASLYAKYLRNFAEQRGLKRIEGKIINVQQNAETGNLEELTLMSGELIKGNYFIDCSGFRSLLLKQTLNAEWEDWSQWLLCDRAVAVPSDRSSAFTPYTRSTAKAAGWQWRIPLQHRTGNGYVYHSGFISDDEATQTLLNGLDAPAINDPRIVKFKAGRYKNSWQKNCIALGLSSGFLEPLESTSIYLIQAAIINFLALLPDKSSNSLLANEFNRLMDIEYERVRDFLILHYHLNNRDDSDLWRYCRNMQIPDSLSLKMELFKKRGYVDAYKYGLFAPASWVSVFHGQGLMQEAVDPYVYNLSEEKIIKELEALSHSIKQKLQMMPMHADFIADYCGARPM